MTNPELRTQANAFLVWRVATSLKWNVTRAQLVKETGLSAEQIHRVINTQGWAGRIGRRSDEMRIILSRSGLQSNADHFIDENRLDLVQIFQSNRLRAKHGRATE